MIQNYRIVIDIFNQHGYLRTLGEKHIRTRSLNSAKAQATNFSFTFDEMRPFWGTIERGWSKPRDNGGVLYVRYLYTNYRRWVEIRCEWRDPQLRLGLDAEIADVRLNNAYILSCFAKTLEGLLKEPLREHLPNEKSIFTLHRQNPI